MAKYRYLPRILRAWIAVDQLGPAALEVGDWDGMEEVVRRADDAITALPLYTNAVEGSRSGKRKKKTDSQKQMLSDLKVYKEGIGELEKAVAKKDVKKANAALAKATPALLSYRQIAKIDAEDGGVVQIPMGNAEEVNERAALNHAPGRCACACAVLCGGECTHPHPTVTASDLRILSPPAGRPRRCSAWLRHPRLPRRRREHGLRAARRRADDEKRNHHAGVPRQIPERQGARQEVELRRRERAGNRAGIA